VEDLISSFIRQLLERHPSVLLDIQSFYNAHKQGATRPTKQELRELFQNLCSHLKAVYISIDALDEVSDNTKYDMFGVVPSILGVVAQLSNANVFLVSRPLDSFEYSLPEVRSSPLDPREDIKLLLLKELKGTPHFRRILMGDGSFIQEIVEKVKTKSEGV